MSAASVPPGPKFLVPGQYYLPLACNPAGFLTKLAHEYGDMVMLRWLGMPIYMLNHPHFVHTVLAARQDNFTDGPAVRRVQRIFGSRQYADAGRAALKKWRLVPPVFHTYRLESYADGMVGYTALCAAAWEEGQTVDIVEVMRRLTLTIVGMALFEVYEEKDALMLGQTVSELWTTGSRRPIRQIGERFEAFLALRASFEAGASQPAGSAPTEDNSAPDGASALYLAGHEIVSPALAWTWQLLAQHPQVEAKLHAELDAVLANRLPGAGDLERLPYTRQVFAEALRLYPPVWVMARQSVNDDVLGGFVIPGGAVVLLSQWVMHRDARYYPDPLRFDPNRWLPEAAAARPSDAYFPFGSCQSFSTSERFAWMEGVLILATLAQRWRLRAVSTPAAKPQLAQTFRPPRLMMRVERRMANGV